MVNVPDATGLTSDATVRRGPEARHGHATGYRRLTAAPGEPYVVRDDSAPRPVRALTGQARRARHPRGSQRQAAQLTAARVRSTIDG